LVLDYVTAIGAAGAFVVATAIFFTSTRSAKLDRRQAQAVLVDAWIKSAEKNTSTNKHRVIFEVSNHSDQAIRQLFVEIYSNDGPPLMPYVKAVVPPTVRGEYAAFQTNDIDTPVALRSLDADAIRGIYKLNFTFVDTAGRKWTRNFQGKLVDTTIKMPSRRSVAKLFEFIRDNLPRGTSSS
jgi:hypothetical protein